MKNRGACRLWFDQQCLRFLAVGPRRGEASTKRRMPTCALGGVESASVLCHAVLCYACVMLCHVVPCRVTPCRAYSTRSKSWLCQQRCMAADTQYKNKLTPTSTRNSLSHSLSSSQVRPRTSERRKTLVDIVHDYSDSNGDVKSMPARGRPLDPDQYQTALLNSRFTLSPAGHNAECFRTWEALEAG